MMSFSAHSALALQLIAIALGTLLIARGMEKPNLGFAKFIGVVVVIIGVLSLLGTLYCMYVCWSAGYFNVMPMAMMHQMAQSAMS